MTKLFFVSTRKDRSAEANALSAELAKRGWERTYEWKALERETLEDLARLALDEIEAVKRADVLVVLLPGGFGTHAEIGAALALGKRVVLHAPDRKALETPYRCPFHYHPNVKLIVSEALAVGQAVALMES